MPQHPLTEGRRLRRHGGKSMKARRWVRAIAGVSVLAAASVGLLATGVAGAADDSSTQFDNLKPIKAPSPCKNDTGVDDSTIKVGTIVPTSGPFALFYSQALDGIKARVAQANAEGELGNRKIELVNVDDAGDAARNVTSAQQLAEQDKVFGIITESNAGDASGEYLHDQKVPVVGWQLGLPVYGTYPNYFGMQNANTENIKEEFTTRNSDVIQALGGTKLADRRLERGEQRRLHRAGEVGDEADQGSEDRLHQPRHPGGHHRVRFGRRPDQAVGRRLHVHRARQRREHRPHVGAEAGRREAEAGHLPRRLQPARARPADLRRRVLRHRVQAVRARPRRRGRARRLQEVDGHRSAERAAQPDHRGGVDQRQHVHRGHQGRRREVPDAQGVHQQPAPREGLHGQRLLRRPGDHDRLRQGLRQAVLVRVLRARREQAVRAAVRREAVLCEEDDHRQEDRRRRAGRRGDDGGTTTTAAP